MEVMTSEASPTFAGSLFRWCFVVILFIPASLVLVSVISTNRSDLPLAAIATSVTDYPDAYGDSRGEKGVAEEAVAWGPELSGNDTEEENKFPGKEAAVEEGMMIGCSEGNSLAGCHDVQRAQRSRLRRSLTFLDGSKATLRVNFKYILFPTSNWLAYANGFRMGWDLPKNGSVSLPFARTIQRREIYRDIEEIMVHHGMDGRACILRGLCEAARKISPSNGIIRRVLHLFFTVPEEEEHLLEEYNPDEGGWRVADEDGCDSIFPSCPFSLIDMSSLGFT